MDKFKCRVVGISKDWKTGQAQITLQTDKNILKEVEQLQEVDLSCSLKKFRKSRSLDANAYCWVLLDKLAANLKIPKEELYKCYIKQIGGNNTAVCVQDKALGELCEKWVSNGLGWQYDTLESKIEGCTTVILYYGSSTYDTEQMSRLIDMVVQDCKACGIETITPNELAKIKAGWNSGR